MGNDFQKLEDTIGKFSTILLEEMDTVQLMNRLDTKYIFHVERLKDILEIASDQYKVLSINDRRIFRYSSLYYDTTELRSYLDHHNGIRPRYKVRFREYEDTGGIYLEVKRKFPNERTRKSRIKVDTIEQNLSTSSADYISERSPFNPALLQPSLWTIFRRITLVGRGAPERITIDIDPSFSYNDKDKSLPFLCICEVKKECSGGTTEFMRILKNHRIYPGSSSKYCLGNVLLKDGIKYNRFKSLLLELNRIENVYRLSPFASQPA